MKKTIREFDKKGNLVKEIIIEKEEEEKIKYVPYDPFDYDFEPNVPYYKIWVGDNPDPNEIKSDMMDFIEKRSSLCRYG